MTLRQFFSKTRIPPIWGGTDINISKNNPTSCKNLIPSYFSKESTLKFPIDLLPLEILYIIIEKLDVQSFVNCLHVSNKWRSVTLSIANADKTNQRWQAIFELHHEEETFCIKSCNMSYKDLFTNSLRWNMDFSFGMIGSCPLQYIKKINIYKDNIIVIDYEGVKYFNINTYDMKIDLHISECFDFNERDAFVVRGTQVQCHDVSLVKLLLYGKKDPDDVEFQFAAEMVMNYDDPGMDHDNSVIVGDVSQFAIENNCCYVMNAFSNVLSCYTWNYQQWEMRNLGRFYGNRDDLVYAMNVLNTEIYLLIKWGQMMHYCYDKKNFLEVHRVRMPVNKTVFVKMVHKYCIVIGVPNNCSFRISRMRNNEGYNFYKLECPKLTCVTQHGEMLLLGFSDGKVDLVMPRAVSRKDIFKRRFHISDFISTADIEPEDLIVISIDVFEDLKQHYLYISTHSCVYQLVIMHKDETCVWNNIPERVMYYKYPIQTRYSL